MDLKPAHLKRYGNVARLLIKYGRSTASRNAETLPDEVSPPPAEGDAEMGAELAQDLESLGPTFIKRGQILSSRGALIPPSYVEALERLQDSVEPFSFEDVERIVTEELGVRISKGFDAFEPTPLAGLSIATHDRKDLKPRRRNPRTID